MAVVKSCLRPHFAKVEGEWLDSAKKVLSKAQYCKFAAAVLDYYIYGDEPELPKNAQLVFETLRPQLDYRRKKSIEQLEYQAKVSKERETPLENQNGFEMALVQSPAETREVLAQEPIGSLVGEIQSTCDFDTFACGVTDEEVGRSSSSRLGYIDRKKDKVSSSSRAGTGTHLEEGAKTIAPTFAEVKTYCERCGLVVSPEKFFDHYEGRGWLDGGGRPIVDWRGKLNAWNKREGRYPEKAQALDAGNNGVGRKRLKIACVTSTRGDDKNEGMWFIRAPSEYAGIIPGSKGVGRDEAIRLAIELHPDLSEATEK